jgi:ABC-type sugar transport system ATPase subunit
MASIELRGIEKRFAGGATALRDIDVRVAYGERLALVGPSGSGKSTLLRIIAGLEQPTAGQVLIDGADVTGTPPERRDLAMVFQNYALYPHKSVRENLAFALTLRKVARAEIVRRVADTAASLGIRHLLDRRPSQLSGGQRQRVALGRAIIREPRAFLFDEPLSNLDPQLRGDTRAELIQLHGRLGATMVYVTHDQEEAMTLGQRIAILRDGRVEQAGTPADVYGRPATTFVARFIGSPAMNLLPAAAIAGVVDPRGAAEVGIRPHDLAVAEASGPHVLAGTVQVVEPLGHAQTVRVETPAGLVVASLPPAPAIEPGARLALAIDPERVHRFDAGGRRIAEG